MKCPLLCLAKTAHYSENVMITTDCLKEEYGWWDKDKGMCSRVSETVELRLIRALLKDIRDKMPREEQLRRDK